MISLFRRINATALPAVGIAVIRPYQGAMPYDTRALARRPIAGVAACLQLLACDAPRTVQAAENAGVNEVAEPVEQPIAINELTPTARPAEKNVMADTKPTAQPPSKPSAREPKPEKEPQPLQRPDEVDPPHREPGDEVPR